MTDIRILTAFETYRCPDEAPITKVIREKARGCIRLAARKMGVNDEQQLAEIVEEMLDRGPEADLWSSRIAAATAEVIFNIAGVK